MPDPPHTKYVCKEGDVLNVSIQAYITRQYFATAVCVFDRQSGGGIEVDKGGVKKLPLLLFTTIILIICPWWSSS